MNTTPTKTNKPSSTNDLTDVPHDGTLDIVEIAGGRRTVEPTPPADTMTKQEQQALNRLARPEGTEQLDSPDLALNPDAVQQRQSDTDTLGSAYPGEVVAAFWNPGAHPQYMSYGHTDIQFLGLSDARRDAGFRLIDMQIYAKNGSYTIDHLWNTGTYPQIAFIAIEPSTFGASHNQYVSQGYHLEHLESYVNPNGGININAFWNQNWASVTTTWVQGWAEGDLNWKIGQMYNSGWRLRNINAWNLPNNGPVRYDAVWEQWPWRAEFVRLNMTGAQVVQEYNTQWSRGWKLWRLQSFRQGNEQRYAGLWTPNNNGQLVLWGHSREQIDAQYGQSWQEGWRMGGMDMVKF